ncbi:hypothetical protein GC170_12795 [bacterium]|nr:hypothetical protein [bacterium]
MNATHEINALSFEDAMSALGALYEEVDADIARHAPVCRLSARCCRFREFGHDLFVSALEREFWLRAGEPAVASDAWRPGENCPWQSESGMCHARKGRPLGCRVYYCDPAYESVMPDITEPAIARIKRITGQAGMAWDYRPAHEHLKETESAWRISSTARFTGESAALATGDTSSHRDHPQEGEP